MKKKKDLLKLNLQHFADLTLDQVKAWLEANKANSEVQTYLGELSTPTVEGVEGFLDTEAGRKLLQPRLDSNFTKGLNTWKEKNLDKLVDDEVKKRNPDETPEQKRIRELEEKIEKAEKDSQRDKLVNAALQQFSDKKLPTDLVNFFVGQDEETTNQNVTTFAEKFDAAVTAAVDAKFKNGGRDVTGGAGTGNDEGAYGNKLAEQSKNNNVDLEKHRQSYFE